MWYLLRKITQYECLQAVHKNSLLKNNYGQNKAVKFYFWGQIEKYNGMSWIWSAPPLLPYSWAALVFKKAHTQSAEPLNRYADSFVRDSEGHRLFPKHTKIHYTAKVGTMQVVRLFALSGSSHHRVIPALMGSLGGPLVQEPLAGASRTEINHSYCIHFINLFPTLW